MTVPLPQPVQEGVQAALARLGLSAKLDRVEPVGGGCINHGVHLKAADGGSFFLKWNASAPPRLFDAEADGLRALREAGPVRVPEPLARGGGSGSPSWLLMEWIEPGSPAADHDERLGHGLALLHASAAGSGSYGWKGANWIGSLPQSNRTSDSWAAFWRDQRLAPQLTRALDRGHFNAAERGLLGRALEAVPAALADVEGTPPALLHGDLWSGNAYAAADGGPVLIDPATYRGHGEVDLAMTELFGGFGARFYQAYDEAAGISEAYRAYRRDLYQLYYLLVHVNLFGAQYESRTLAAARRVVTEVGA